MRILKMRKPEGAHFQKQRTFFNFQKHSAEEVFLPDSSTVVSLQSKEVFGSWLCRERKERRRRREKETARLPDWAARDVRS